jgi:NAD(P)-dependent dehydrogenase (short-subunit alcohol dehydrogenase family)
MPDTEVRAEAAPAHRVFITGAYGALGTAVSEAFVRAGHRVARVNHGPVPASAANASSFGIGNTDLSDPGAAARAIAEALRLMGGIDVVVNVAGGFAWEKLSEHSAETWQRQYALNLATCLNTCMAAIPHLPRGGRIINIGAMAAAHAAAGMGAYTAAKSGVHRLTESLAAELRSRDITVNALLPTTIDTPQNRLAMPKADPGSWTSPQAIAEVILYLASAQSQAINGALIPVGGTQ